MLNIKNTFSRFKRNARNRITNIKNKPRSKRKSLFLGFTTVLGIFGVTLLAPVLPAVAKDLSKKGAKPDQLCPAPTPKPAVTPSQQIIGGLSGAAATVCALAVTSGSFMVGAVCGVIVVVGILKAQGK